MRALLLALALLVLAPTSARAGTMLLAPVIQGAGTVAAVEGISDFSCTKTNDFNDDASSRCAAQLVDTTTVWLHAYPDSHPGWAFAGWDGCDQTRGTGATAECAITPPPAGQVNRNPVARFADTVAPTVALTVGPVDGATVKPTFSSPDALASFRCRFDGADFAACAAGTEYTLADGPHSFGVVAVDPSSNAGPEQTATWETDVSPPTVALQGGPAEGGFTASRSATFTIAASADTKTTTCALNGAPCSLPIQLSSLADGPYTLTVTVSDGHRQAAATRTWTIDTTAPDTGLDAALRITSNEPGASFECSLDAQPFTACPAAFPRGRHTLAVRARDRAGNVDVTPATRTYTVAAPIAITVPYFVKASRRGTVFTALAVKGVPRGATVKVTCKGGCPRSAQTIRAAKAGTVQLAAWRRRRFKPGAKLTIAVTAPGARGMAKTFAIRAAKRPRITTKTLALAS